MNAAAQYLAVYALANIVGFLALAVVSKVRGSTSFDDLSGLARTDPWVGVPLAFAVLVLAGFPPAVIGLVAKYVVFVPVVSGRLDVGRRRHGGQRDDRARVLPEVRRHPVRSAPSRPSSAASADPPACGWRRASCIVGALALLAASVWPSVGARLRRAGHHRRQLTTWRLPVVHELRRRSRGRRPSPTLGRPAGRRGSSTETRSSSP